jgi:arabinosaccharide transport system substrate-binding protein
MKLNDFPYGKAPLLILVLAVVSGLLHGCLQLKRRADKPDLVFAIFAANHEEAYREVLPEFEREHGVKVQLQRVNSGALQSRLQSALLTGAEVPDMVELLEGSMGYFTRGPLEDVGFVDLTDRLHAEGWYACMVESRFTLWSSRGRTFALPHDVHPVTLCYRRDLVESLGIDVTTLKTWDDFVAMGRRITADLDGDGNPDRYALDLSAQGGDALLQLVLQRGGGLFDANGAVAFDSEIVADTIAWYVHQVEGEDRIAYDAGWGQGLTKAMMDGLVLFYLCPDWRTKLFEMDIPQLEGKLGLIPFPTWTEGGCRTSTWGGTGLAITRRCERPELAWELAKFLYLRSEDLASRFRATNILPPLKDSWDLAAFDEPRPYWGGQAIGALYAELAAETPSAYASPFLGLAKSKMGEAYLNALDHYRRNGDAGLDEAIRSELKRTADYVRRVAARNVFLNVAKADGTEGERP